jgi:hypothetical protein
MPLFLHHSLFGFEIVKTLYLRKLMVNHGWCNASSFCESGKPSWVLADIGVEFTGRIQKWLKKNAVSAQGS